ncbi:RNA polymerase sigma factor [Aminipila terrae]|uniref:Sigma-70 family RNA polymerase sigma factor n=1 Tax=Aminipila terrae TaxID=2697030 RepID=A0A6P1MDP9_9FIRM|nr:sigma-70 family RNA polymerase sigma factor [Aminipila terrae]QHI72770.1 sigma-70 family RNA polymerase sigma factor [Aminipila terrae]
MVDINLVTRCKTGDLSAFEELYETCSTKALRTAFSIVNRYDLAEDVIQETFYECFRDIHKLSSPEAFGVWFYRILVRTSWRMLSSERKFSHEELAVYESRVKDPHDCFKEIESNELINAINRLSLPMRTTVILHYYNDLPVKDIARIMNCFQGTVKSRLYSSRKKLAKELKRQSTGILESEYVERGCSFEE